MIGAATWEANSGGPMSRTRAEAIRATLLGADHGPIRCAQVVCLALDFGADDPCRVMSGLLATHGLDDPECLRDEFEVPPPMLCEVDMNVVPLHVKTADPQRVLRDALLLGLCTAVFFDPARPVIWTRASLTRRLRLYDMTEFYA